MDSERHYVGVDVAKYRLDLAVHPAGECWSVRHDGEGMAAALARLQQLHPYLIVLEATGGLELPFASLLATAGLPVAVVSPRHARDFARASGTLAKTDRVDAALLARMGVGLDLHPRPLPDAAQQALDALVTRRRELLEMLTAERNHLDRAPQVLREGVRAHIAWLRKELAVLDDDLQQTIHGSPLWRVTDELLRSVPGVGPVLSATLVAELPELGRVSHKEVAALVACMRKLSVYLNAMIRDQTPWRSVGA